MLEAFVLVFVQALPSGGTQVGTRPVECGAIDGGRAANVWERAKAPELRRYCDLLASGAAKLAGAGTMAAEVISIADEADRAIPGRAAAGVLRGRALARLGRFPLAVASFDAAKGLDDAALDDPAALLAYAHALEETGADAESLRAYRVLLPRVSTLSIVERGPAYLEAGMLAMGRGSDGIQEAVSILRQARRESQDTAQSVAFVALALALDRAGAKAEARVTLAERVFGELSGALAHRARVSTLGARVVAESDAMLGLLLETAPKKSPNAPREAREAWQRYSEALGSKGPWAEHARQHLAALGGKVAAPAGKGGR